ncbi:MAG: ABC transporter permease [Deltaproteobacteria bacterium]|nr:ABC transporter permease [Deltaproteobacteria bacterium]MBW2663706.1 ABC transporter permease [Deltaproteobacteria bacterium]
MIFFYKKAIQDIRDNKYLNVITIITISLSILIVSSSALFFVNANDIMRSWEKGISIIAYLKPDIVETALPEIKGKIQGMYGVAEVKFISKEKAMKRLKGQMKGHSSLLADLQENPLPDAFEISLLTSSADSKKVEKLAAKIEAMSFIEEAEYGRRWLERFTNVFDLFRLAGYAMAGIFFIAAVFIVANTIRLVIYSRQNEIEIMRLVGATDRFVKTPFYIESLIQSAIGGIVGLASLFVIFILITLNVGQVSSSDIFHIRFLSSDVLCGIMIGSIFVGWLGCYISLKQFLKYEIG